MNRTIVVGVDHSGPSQGALEWAVRRADRLSPSVRIRAELHHGSVTGTLSEGSKGAVLVVVGTDKRGRIEGELFGSVSLQIAALSHAPVAVIPLVPEAGRTGVVVGVDGSADSLDAVAFAAAEADRTGQDLEAVYACRIPNPWAARDIPEDSIMERIEQEERVVLAESVAGLTERYPDLVVTQRLEPTQVPARAVVAAAAYAQLLVVGSRGRGAPSGSCSDRSATRSSCTFPARPLS